MLNLAVRKVNVGGIKGDLAPIKGKIMTVATVSSVVKGGKSSKLLGAVSLEGKGNSPNG